MREAILDTGPPLHLHEIGRLGALGVFDRLTVPTAVQAELRRYGAWSSLVEPATPQVRTVEVSRTSANHEMERGRGEIQAADAEVLAWARETCFELPVLTDDLALRHLVVAGEGRAVGSFGILLRAFKIGLLEEDGLRTSVDNLLTKSTLHLGREFRRYMRDRLSQLLAE